MDRALQFTLANYATKERARAPVQAPSCGNKMSQTLDVDL
jgi:hypothetical protein